MAEETCASAKLDWTSIDRAPHSEWLDWYRRVLSIRRAEIVPLLATIHAGGRYEVLKDGAVLVRWPLRAGDALVLAANLSATPARGFPAEPGRVLWQEGEIGHDGTFGPWTVRWSAEDLLRHEPASPALDELAERMGIERQFRNAKGEIVETSSETKRSMLAAMGGVAAPLVCCAGKGSRCRSSHYRAGPPCRHRQDYLASDAGGWLRTDRTR